MNTIDDIRQQFNGLRNDLHLGKVFSSLGSRTGKIIDSVQRAKQVSSVQLPNDEDGIVELLDRLKADLKKGTLDEINDRDLFLLITHLGSPAAAIRDKGVFYVFNDLIQQQILTQTQLMAVFDQLISDENLFSHILEPDNDGIYQRSFSVMLISTLIYIDRAGITFIDAERKNQLVEQLALYIMLENDTRGYEDAHGWIHAYTHIGNVLDELASDFDLIRADKLILMAIFIEKFQRIETPLIFGEPTRLASYLADQSQEDDLYQQFLLIELREWRRSLAMIRVRESSAMWNRLFNRQRLLQSLILNANVPQAIQEYLEDTNDFTM